ncbi:MAG: acetylornithine deacetylase/succinyl-diaminopimelate desuccinylase-like protein, partial [Granulosicoccus sp.]
MKSSLPSTIDILTRLVSFDSISAKPTHDIVQYICDYLSAHGVEA